MALNYPGPYEVRIIYVANGHEHSMRLNCDVETAPDPGDLLDTINFMERSGAPVQADSAVEAYVNLIKVNFHTSTTFLYAELWKYEPDSNAADYISTWPLNIVGTSVTASVPASQLIWVFRTIEGGVLKLNHMEGVRAVGAPILYAALGAGDKALVDFIISVDNWILAKDTSYPFAFTRLYPGQNEALFKKYFRQET